MELHYVKALQSPFVVFADGARPGGGTDPLPTCRCGATDTPPGARFCIRCGAALPTPQGEEGGLDRRPPWRAARRIALIVVVLAVAGFALYRWGGDLLGPSDPARDATLYLCNPYGEAVHVRVGTAAPLTLAPHSATPRRAAVGESLAVDVSLASDGTPIARKDVVVPAGASLVTVGGAALYEWRWEPAHAWVVESVPPAWIVPIDLPLGARLSEPSSGGDAAGDGALLRMILPGDERKGLHVLALAPLLPPLPRALPRVVRHPGVAVTEMVPPPPLRDAVVRDVATHGNTVVVVAGGSAYAWATGRRLHAGEADLHRVACAADRLVFLTRQARLARIEAGRLVEGASLLDPTVRLAWGGTSQARGLLIYGGAARPDLEVLVAGASHPRRLLAEDPPVNAVCTTRRGLLLARGSRVELLTPRGRSELLALPGERVVIGIAEYGDTIAFATSDAVLLLRGRAVLPLALGVGGPLHALEDGLLVHDVTTRRLVRIEGDPLRSPEDVR